MEVANKDPGKGHFYVSLIKSGLRIVAAYQLTQGDLLWAGTLFGLAEVLGIVEEVV